MNRLREVRKQKGFIQQELGRAVGKYQTYIYLIEKGYLNPPIHEKEALARVLDVDVSDIFPDTPKQKSAIEILNRSKIS